MQNELVDTVVGYFEEKMGLQGLSGDVAFLGGEAFVTIKGVEPSSSMHEFARAIEHEYDELGLHLRIALKRS
jgi:hypothetical protein